MNIDDIQVRHWYMVSGDYAEQLPWQPRRQLHGVPFRVVAISLPFIAVESYGKRYTIDTREVQLTRANRSYVRAFAGRKPRRKRDRPDERACPRCGFRLCQRHIDGVWRVYCRECGFQGPEASAV